MFSHLGRFPPDCFAFLPFGGFCSLLLVAFCLTSSAVLFLSYCCFLASQQFGFPASTKRNKAPNQLSHFSLGRALNGMLGLISLFVATTYCEALCAWECFVAEMEWTECSSGNMTTSILVADFLCVPSTLSAFMLESMLFSNVC